jgi:hypothetical protein
VDAVGTKVADSRIEPTREAENKIPFKLSGELLNGGQGKDNSMVTSDCIDNISFVLEVKGEQGGVGEMEGSCLPQLENTEESVRGDMNRVLHRENRQR